MIAAHSIAERVIALLVLGVITWWVVAPKSYIACIRKVLWLWMSTYPPTPSRGSPDTCA